MLDYIKKLLPRLKKYSKDLDKIENFVDREWVLIDDGGNNQTYEFMRDGRLVMTLVSNNGTNQQTQIGSWDLLGSGRLLITRPQGALTLNQGFLGDMLLILQESGTSNNPFCCYDPKKISQAEINYHLDQFLVASEKAGTPTLPTNTLKYGADGKLFTGFEKKLETEDQYCLYREGRVVGDFFRNDYGTDKGSVVIYQKQSKYISWYDIVCNNIDNVPDGLYKFASKQDEEKADCIKIRVRNGQVDYLYSIIGKLFYYILFALGLIFVLALALSRIDFGN